MSCLRLRRALVLCCHFSEQSSSKTTILLLLMPPCAIFKLSAHSCWQSLDDNTTSIEPFLHITFRCGFCRWPTRVYPSNSSSRRLFSPFTSVSTFTTMLLTQGPSSERERLSWLLNISLNGSKEIVIMINPGGSGEFGARQIRSRVAFARAASPPLVSFVAWE